MHVSIPRAGGYAALAAPVLMWVEFVSHGLARQGYDLITRPFSDLATKGTPQAAEFMVGFFIVPGLLTVMVGLGLWFAHRQGRVWRIGSVLIVTSGVFLFATGLFQQDPTSILAGLLHGTMAQTCFAIASLAPLMLFLGSVGASHLRPPRRLWLVAGLAALAIEVFGITIRPLAHFPDGAFQRPFTLVLTVWFVATGLWLVRMRTGEAAPAIR